MRIDPEDLRRHYASLSDEALADLDRNDLVEMAQSLYDAEIARRRAARRQDADLTEREDGDASFDSPVEFEDAEGDADIDMGPPPEWLDDAACACAFSVHPGTPYPADVAKARAALRAAGIPCHITMNEVESPDVNAAPFHEYCLMVPGALNLHATSVLDRDLFNAQQEANWRNHIEALSDKDLLVLKPEIFCAGFLDRAARLKRAYNDELARRNIQPRSTGRS